MKNNTVKYLKKLIDAPSRQKEIIITHHHKDHTKGL
jgi:metal-dependent hydrolase (beta-lactamase superfamily II)